MTYFIAFASALLQNDDAGLIASILGSTISCICGGVVFLIVVIGLWKVFEKADEPGWAAIIPIYNYYILLKIVGRPWWWLLLLLIPLVNFFVTIIVAIDLAKSFGKDVVYGIVLLWFFSVIGFMILGFGDAQYLGPAAAQKT